jgi:hypothetical protein
MNHVRTILLGLLVPALAASTSLAQNAALISASQQLEIKTRYADLVERVVKNELAAQAFESTVPPIVSVKLEFDQKRLEDDAQKFVAGQQDAAMNRLKALMDTTSPKANEAQQAAEAQVIAPASNGVRFGRLNIDLNREALTQILARKEPEGQKAASPQENRLAVSLQMPETTGGKSFQFDPADYIVKMTIDVMIPEGVPESVDATLKTRIADALNLTAIASDKAQEWIKIGRLPKPEAKAVVKAGIGDWVQGLFSPSNVTLGLMIVGIFVGLCILLATILLAKVFAKMAAGIKDLKPAEEKKEEGGGDKAEATQAAEAPAQDAHAAAAHGDAGGGHGKRHEHDPAASVQALTSEMATIRDQLFEIVAENDQLFAELLRDLFYQQHGLEDIRDLLSFAGYKAIRPALEKLPKQSIEQLQAFVEDSNQDPVSLLHGVEVAQRLYRACISKISGTGPEAGDLDRLSQGLVAADDAVITQMIGDMTGQQLAFMLRTLSVSRGNALIRSIPSDKLREATSLLDKMPENAKEIVDGILEKIASLEGQKAKKSNLQLRFVLRLVRNASIDEEASVLEMIGPEEWDFKLDLMRTKFFYTYVKYLPMTFVRSILDGVPVRMRAEILHVAEEPLRNAVLATFQEGSKLKEMLMTEIEQIRLPTLEAFMGRLRAILVERQDLLDQVILKQCEVEKLTPPERIQKGQTQAEAKVA